MAGTLYKIREILIRSGSIYLSDVLAAFLLLWVGWGGEVAANAVIYLLKKVNYLFEKMDRRIL
jgi:hypothetical protein